MDPNITLIISGTRMSGFRYVVDREWALQVSNQVLINTIRNEMFRIAETYDLKEHIQTVKLHIHDIHDNDTKEIYICECNHENI